MTAGLCYIGQVVELAPIADADRIVLATVVAGKGGKWRGVVPKDGLAVGSHCQVYLQDALVPRTLEFAFMEPRGWRVRMARFRGAPSECLIMAQTIPGDVGDDVTEAAGVQKFEKPVPMCMSGETLGAFPSFIPRTDEPHFQGVPHLVEALQGRPWVATEKADGTSCTIYHKDGHVGVCSRSWEKKDDGKNVYWRAARDSGIVDKIAQLGNVAIQCEIVGPGIQKNRLGLRDIEVRVFDAWDIDRKEYRTPEELALICAEFRWPIVQRVGGHGSFDLDGDALQRLAEGLYPGTTSQREGIVVRALVPFFVGNDRVSFKVLNLRYKD